MAKNKVGIFHKSVDDALNLLEQFHGDVDELGVTELSKALNLSKNNVFRILATLESKQYIVQNREKGCYRLGIKALSLGQTFKKQMGLLRKARPVLEELVSRCNETSSVTVQKDLQLVNLDTVETEHPVRVVPRVGIRLPLYCTAAGKIHLAHMTDRELDAYLSGRDLRRHTPTTITDREMLGKHLALVAEQGYAVDNEEFDSGVRCVSAPIRDYTRRIIGAVNISGPSIRFSDNRLEFELIPLVRKAAEEISFKLGFRREFLASYTSGISCDDIVRRVQAEFRVAIVNQFSLSLVKTDQQMSRAA